MVAIAAILMKSLIGSLMVCGTILLIIKLDPRMRCLWTLNPTPLRREDLFNLFLFELVFWPLEIFRILIGPPIFLYVNRKLHLPRPH